MSKRIVQHHLETFLACAAEADPLGGGVPFWVENDFRAYLRCGILAHGFARARCDGCGAERLIAFSCKGRGIVRSTATAETAVSLYTRWCEGKLCEGALFRLIHFHATVPLLANELGTIAGNVAPYLP